MPTTTRAGSLLHLISNLREESKTFLHEEVQLAKAEIAEKVSSVGRNAIFIAVGGIVAYTASIFLLIGLSLVLVFAFQKAGLSRDISLFTGPLSLGLILGVVGYLLFRKGMNGISGSSLAPEKTIETLKGEAVVAANVPEKKQTEEAPKPSCTTMQSQAEKTRDQLESTVAEIKHRISPGHIRDTMVMKVKQNPVPVAAIAFGSIAGFWLLRHRSRAGHLEVGSR